ncbi:hypothetical protein BHE74_00010808 [Ensete ventricosum]|nr:hypothetical protein GW17_00025536 [Ensete ventricosum]RWW80832.1 hypothetical protein BHE74_00010808 [Ensete ventricosum]
MYESEPRNEKKKLEEELAEVKNEVMEMSSESEEVTIQKLQDEIKECKAILKCGVCFDRPKEVIDFYYSGSSVWHFSCLQKSVIAGALDVALHLDKMMFARKDAGGGDEGIEDARCDMSASSTKIERFSNDVLLGLDHRRVVVIEEVGSKEGHDVGINEGVRISKSCFDKRRISTMVSATNFDSVTMEH